MVPDVVMASCEDGIGSPVEMVALMPCVTEVVVLMPCVTEVVVFMPCVTEVVVLMPCVMVICDDSGMEGIHVSVVW